MKVNESKLNTKVTLIYDHENNGWFCRIKFADGREVDSLPPVASQFTDPDMAEEDLMELVYHSLSWENNTEDYDLDGIIR